MCDPYLDFGWQRNDMPPADGHFGLFQ